MQIPKLIYLHFFQVDGQRSVTPKAFTIYVAIRDIIRLKTEKVSKQTG